MMIRALSPHDAPPCAKLHGESFEAAWDEDAIMVHIEKDLCLGGFAPDLSGFIILSLAADQAEILTLAVARECRRKGLAQKLVSAACQAAVQRGAAVLFLEVAEDNRAAIALYKSCGFIPIGRRPAYYRRADGRIAALTYRKDLLE